MAFMFIYCTNKPVSSFLSLSILYWILVAQTCNTKQYFGLSLTKLLRYRGMYYFSWISLWMHYTKNVSNKSHRSYWSLHYISSIILLYNEPFWWKL